jgi:hypothetical protein
MSEELQRARRTIRDGVRAWFTQLRDNHPSERFYALAFCFYDDFVGPHLWTNSLERLTDKWGDDPGDYAWHPGDGQWAPEFCMDFDAWQALAKYDSSAHNVVDDVVLQYRAKCLGATMTALKDLADDGFWNRQVPGVLVYVLIWDTCEKWVDRESVRRINSPELFASHPLLPGNYFGDVFSPDKPQLSRRQARKPPSELASVFYAMFGEQPPEKP